MMCATTSCFLFLTFSSTAFLFDLCPIFTAFFFNPSLPPRWRLYYSYAQVRAASIAALCCQVVPWKDPWKDPLSVFFLLLTHDNFLRNDYVGLVTLYSLLSTLSLSLALHTCCLHFLRALYPSDDPRCLSRLQSLYYHRHIYPYHPNTPSPF